MSAGAELGGGGPHDGMLLDFHTRHDVVALAVVTREPDGTLSATLAERDGAGVDRVTMRAVMQDLVFDLTDAPAQPR